jgi:hypothetical protein
VNYKPTFSDEDTDNNSKYDDLENTDSEDSDE